MKLRHALATLVKFEFELSGNFGTKSIGKNCEACVCGFKKNTIGCVFAAKQYCFHAYGNRGHWFLESETILCIVQAITKWTLELHTVTSRLYQAAVFVSNGSVFKQPCPLSNGRSMVVGVDRQDV